MAELTITPEEAAAATYVEWSDEALGRAVKKIALFIQDRYGEDSINLMAVGALMVADVRKHGAKQLTLTLTGVEEDGRQLGDWTIVVKDASSKSQDSADA